MECAQPKCVSKSENDRMLSFWICDNNFHLKCVNITGRSCDLLNDKKKGFHWTCHRCSNLNMDLFKFCRQFRQSFCDIGKDLSALNEKLNHYVTLFASYDSHLSSPKRRKIPSKTIIVNKDPVVVK